MVCFFLEGGVPKIHILYIDCSEDDDGGESEDGDGEDGNEREQDLFEYTIFSQECNLTEDEQAYLTEILPSTNAIIGVLTRTNIDNRKMVNFLSM
jgi:hypothetical protein